MPRPAALRTGLMQQTASTILLAGGIDLSTAPDVMPPGRLLAARNYEGAPRGYRSMDGFERFDGQPKPSQSTYAVLEFDAGSAAITAGQTVTGADSGATGKAAINAVVESGTYGGGNAVGYLVLYNVTDTFQDNENLQVAAVTKAHADGTQQDRGADNDADDDTWLQTVIELRRTAILAVPGSGRLRGVWMYNGVGYAFRDNAGATLCVMWKSTAAGWVAVTTDSKWLTFTSGSVEPAVGWILTGATSAKTATVARVILQSGSWAGGDAAGRIVITGPSGAFVAENINHGGTLNILTIAANYTTTALLPGGKYRFRNHNFYGASATKRMYGCDGVNKAFEFDGTTLLPIVTGMATDTPQFIEAHKNHLFLGFPGGSLQFSEPGEPQVWSAVVGAGEIGIGEDLTDMISAVSGVLMVLGLNTVAVLYGENLDNWQLTTLSRDAGGYADTLQNMTEPFYLDAGGIRRMSATQSYGDFTFNTVSQAVQPILDRKKLAGAKPVASLRVRGKNAYRLFFDDGTGILIYLGRLGSLGNVIPEPFEFEYAHVARCVCSYQDENSETLLMGSDDGYVYQLDAGTSADGALWEGYARLAYNHLKSPAVNKAWKKATVTLDTDGGAISLGLVADFDYGNEYSAPAVEQSFSVVGGGGNWDEAYYDEAFWSSTVNGKAEAYIDGLGPSCSLVVFFSAKYQKPHTLQSVTFNYAMRGTVK